jgi:cytochrome c oxidase subunit 3
VAAARTSLDTAERDDPRLAVGLVLFLASESLLFAAFFAAYFTLAGANDTWPPAGTELDVLRAVVFTAVYALSAATMALAVRAARAGDRGESNRWLVASLVLGLVFVVNTFLELATLDFGITTDAYGSIFWVTIGVHWLHVVAGLVVVVAALVVSTGRGVAPLASSRAAAAYYWYFTVALSVLVLVVFYLIQ